MSNAKAADEFAQWYNRSLKLLSLRPRSTREITDYLNRKKIPQPLISRIVEQLKTKNILNDDEFCRWFVASRIAHRPRSIRVLQAELAGKGIQKEIIDDILEKEVGSDTEFAGSIKIAEKKLKLLNHLPALEKQMKLKRYLVQRGYSYTIISHVLSKLNLNRGELTRNY